MRPGTLEIWVPKVRLDYHKAPKTRINIHLCHCFTNTEDLRADKTGIHERLWWPSRVLGGVVD